MSRWINADTLPRHGQRGGLVHWKDIEEAPSIEIVRCSECKHQWREYKVCAHEANVVEGVCGKRAEDNDFCSYGDKRDD
jgi:hypothetical protein